MRLEKQTEANIEQTNENQESIGMSLDMDSAQVLMQMLSKNLYSDAVGSTIRECASNALDSHRRAGVTDPIIVSFQIVNGQYEFSVEDFGIGLDADDVKNIISKYGKSTKRNSTTELGMMGLGFKAPLAYSSSFYFVCRKNGVERKYMMYEGEDTNTIDLMYEKATDQRNGVKVIVPVKTSEKWEFERKIKEQLAYFQDVYFNVPGMNNQFVIFRANDFQWSELCPDNTMHLCLDDVYYPLDFQKLGIGNIDIPVALRFGLSDGIFPTPNREAIRYTKEAKATILEKIGKVADFYVEKYNEQVTESEDLEGIMDWYNYKSRYMTLSGRRLDISSIITFATKKISSPSIKGLNLLSTQFIHQKNSMFLIEYENKYLIEGDRMKKTERSWDRSIRWKEAFEDRHIFYVYSDKVSGNMRDYLKYIHKGKRVHLIKRDYRIPLRRALKQETYYEILNLKNFPKSDWRAVIKEWQHVVSIITDKFHDLDRLEIPQSFIDSKKKVRVSAITANGTKTRRVKLQGEIIGKIAQPLERFVDGQNCKFVSTTFKLQEMHKLNMLHVYGTEKNRKQMDEFFKPFKKCVQFVIFSDREFNAMEKVKIHNWMSMEQFIKGDSRPFKRVATAYLIENLTDTYKSAFKNTNFIGKFSDDMRTKMDELNEYERKYLNYSTEEVKKAILEIAEPNMLVDTNIYSTYKEIKQILDDLAFINVLCGAYKPYNDQEEIAKWECVMRDLFRFNKRRMDWKNYKITLNEDVIAPVTEEIINEA